MFEIENLLRYEYIPEELPPCFNSDLFADKFEILISEINTKKTPTSIPVTFQGFKNITSRRRFSIPNPHQYLNIVKLLIDNEDKLKIIFEQTNKSLTAPIKADKTINKAYSRRIIKFSDSKVEVKKLYKNNLYGLKIDIQTFFDSIYTHSIAWAIHGKKEAKINKGNKGMFGNQLDSALMLLNSSQTNGILVGNAVSRIISEIILCKIDNNIEKKKLDIDYLRYVDDYYIFTKDRSEIDSIISTFREELDNYELVINENKIEVLESPFIYGNSWVEQMKLYASVNPEKLLEKSIIEFHKYNDISIIKYALKILRTTSFTREEWKSIEPIIFNLLLKFPILLKSIIIILKNNYQNVNKVLLKKILYSIIDIHIPLRSEEEIIWVIWAFKVLNISMSTNYIRKILKTENWLAIIILLDITSKRKNEKGIRKILDNFRSKLKESYFPHYLENYSENNMYTEIWMLAYEIDYNKWLNKPGAGNQFLEARKNQFFKLLKKNKISFYDTEYDYELIPENLFNNNTYVTRRELFKILEKIDENNSALDDEEMIEIILSQMHADESTY